MARRVEVRAGLSSAPAGDPLAPDRVVGGGRERGDPLSRGLDLRGVVAPQQVVVLLPAG